MPVGGLSLRQIEDAITQLRAGDSYSIVAVRLGVTKSVLQGQVYRHYPDEVIHRSASSVDRLAALHARMDAVLLDCSPRPSHFIKERR